MIRCYQRNVGIINPEICGPFVIMPRENSYEILWADNREPFATVTDYHKAKFLCEKSAWIAEVRAKLKANALGDLEKDEHL